jgi:hypothetical protein
MIRRWLLSLACEFAILSLVGLGVRACVTTVVHAQIPQVEGSLGHEAGALDLSCQIQPAPSTDVLFFRLLCGGPENFVISVDRHATLARRLTAFVGTRQFFRVGGE